MREKSIHSRKKVLVVTAAVLLLAIAVYLNYRLNTGDIAQSTEELLIEPTSSQQDEDSVVYSEANYFDAFRVNRENVRAKELEYLAAIIGDKRTDAETLKDAQEQKIEIVNNMEKEFTVESLLIAKGFRDAAVTLHQGSVNVIVASEPLTAEQAAQILDIALRVTNIPAENIKVSAKG